MLVIPPRALRIRATIVPGAGELIDVVWTGHQVPGIVGRDTSVVVRQMLRSAQESVLVPAYAVNQGQVVFRELAERIKAYLATSTVEIAAERTAQRQSTAEEPITAKIRRNKQVQTWSGQEVSKSNRGALVEGGPNQGPEAIKPALTHEERLGRERNTGEPGRPPI
jgi:hypothetical protein